MKDNQYPSDEERLAAIRRTQEEMRAPEGVDTGKLVAEASDKFWKTREVGYAFTYGIISEAHSVDGFFARRKIFKDKRLEGRVNHIKACKKCISLLSFTKKALQEYF